MRTCNSAAGDETSFSFEGMDVRLAKKCCSYNWARSLLSNSENREHLKIFSEVDCVLANHNKVQDTQENLKTTN